MVDFDHVVAVGFSTVDLEVGETFAQVGAVGLEDDVLELFFGFLVDLVLGVGRVDGSFGGLDGVDVLNAADENVTQVLLHLEEIGVVLVLGGVLAGLEICGEETHRDQWLLVVEFPEPSLFVDLEVLLVLLLQLGNNLLPLILPR